MVMVKIWANESQFKCTFETEDGTCKKSFRTKKGIEASRPGLAPSDHAILLQNLWEGIRQKDLLAGSHFGRSFECPKSLIFIAELFRLLLLLRLFWNSGWSLQNHPKFYFCSFLN
jgi:hypothetical protein